MNEMFDPLNFAREGDHIVDMCGDGMSPFILAGDHLVVRQQDPQNGQTVIALVNDEATARRYRRDGNTVRLAADNPTVEDIEAPAPDVRVLGLVVGLVRSVA